MRNHLTYNRLSIELSVLDGIHFEDKTEHNGSTVNFQQAIQKQYGQPLFEFWNGI